MNCYKASHHEGAPSEHEMWARWRAFQKAQVERLTAELFALIDHGASAEKKAALAQKVQCLRSAQ